MILHFLYTGSEKGGVQIWGKNLAKTVNTVVTCSFTAGAIERDYINKKLTFQKFSINIFKNKRVIICSDFRAILIGAILTFFLNRGAKLFFIIHSNRKKVLDFPVMLIAKILRPNAYFLATTKEQIQQFKLLRFNTNLISLSSKRRELNYKKLRFQSSKNLMFFGRLSPEKKVELLIPEIKKNMDYNLYIFGDGDTEYVNKLKLNNINISINIGWFDMFDVIESYKIGYIIVPNAYEGISLVSIEAIFNGIIPICRQDSAFSTLNLPEAVRWKDDEDLSNVMTRIKDIGEELIFLECLNGIKKYYKNSINIKDLIGAK